jgi:hypothetical protein
MPFPENPIISIRQNMADIFDFYVVLKIGGYVYKNKAF